MGEDLMEISSQRCSFHIDSVNERKHVGYLSEGATDQIEIKPDTGKPRGEIGQQCAADTANLLFIQYTAAQKA